MTRTRNMIITGLTWLICLIFFFPIAWMFLTGFKFESDAASSPPHFISPFTLEQFQRVFDRDMRRFGTAIVVPPRCGWSARLRAARSVAAFELLHLPGAVYDAGRTGPERV